VSAHPNFPVGDSGKEEQRCFMTNDNLGLDRAALLRLRDHIEREVTEERYDGANVIVARHGEIGLAESIGWADRLSGRRSSGQDVYRLLSLTKAFTNVLALKAIDRGLLSLSTKVIDVIPEFMGPDRFRTARKDRINVAHLLTHRAGLPGTPTPVPYSELGDLAGVIEAISRLDVVSEPGTSVNYSAAVNHALLGEMVRRVYRAGSYRSVCEQELLRPLGLTDTSIGAPKAWADRLVPLKAYIPDNGWLGPHDVEVLNDVITEEAEMPWVGAVATAADIHKFAEMLRRGGEVDGEQLLSPAILDLATTSQTGDLPNNLYSGMAAAMGWDIPLANFGLGFALSGNGLAPSFFSPLTSARTHGNYGAGSTLFWVDPARDLTFVCLTAGVMEESKNVLRFQTLSQMAAAAAR
jgi:CubicO group peptidase (beta-lactamase class C family)